MKRGVTGEDERSGKKNEENMKRGGEETKKDS